MTGLDARVVIASLHYACCAKYQDEKNLQQDIHANQFPAINLA